MELIVYKGPASQTGIAFKKEFQDIPIPELMQSFDEIQELFLDRDLMAVLPVWNSHAGEVNISYVLKMVFEQRAKLYYLWPSEIIFECLGRHNNNVKNGKVISVKVAKHQCSEYIEQNGLSFVEELSTTEAYEKFNKDKTYDFILSAPGMNKNDFLVITSNAQNSHNFTSFALLASSNYPPREGEDYWEVFREKIFSPVKAYIGISMPNSPILSEAQKELFSNLLEDCNDVESMPKPILVARHGESSIRVIFEADFGTSDISDIIGEEGMDETIQIIDDAGFTASEYAGRVMSYLEEKTDTNKDFLFHRGSDSCFFSCPSLGILTHGFEEEVTKTIVLILIEESFNLLSRLGNADSPSKAQTLFNKHSENFYKSGVSFIQFDQVL